jgi:hypothetical protein
MYVLNVCDIIFWSPVAICNQLTSICDGLLLKTTYVLVIQYKEVLYVGRNHNLFRQ